jgi:fumarylacetoacetase
VNGFGVENLPYGVASWGDGRTGCVSALDDRVIDLAALTRSGGLEGVPAGAFDASSLNRFLSLGRGAWSGVRAQLGALAVDGDERLRAASVPMESVELLLPVAVGDFVDFSASLHHATNMARLLRPDAPPPGEEWKRFPRGFHGRAGSVIVSGTPVCRPRGPMGVTAALDIEAELAFVIGTGNRMGEPVPASAMREHVAGVLLLLDWSARDIQSAEQHPLGPFLAKSFATSVSPWLVSLDAVNPTDIELEVVLQGTSVSRPSVSTMYWSIADLLAHATLNGAPTRPGDLFGCGTVSGPDDGTQGSLMELTDGGTRPLDLDDGSTRTYLEDGDSVVIRGLAGNVSLGEVAGHVLPAAGTLT